MKQEFKNAMAIVRQIKDGEWEFKGHLEWEHNLDSFKCYTAARNNVELWVASGGWCCRIKDQPWQTKGFGWLVWILAAGKEVKKLESSMKQRPDDLTQ